MKVLLNSFHLNGHTLGFHLETQKGKLFVRRLELFWGLSRDATEEMFENVSCKIRFSHNFQLLFVGSINP